MHKLNRIDSQSFSCSQEYLYYSIFILCILNTIQIGEYGIDRFVPPLIGAMISWVLYIYNTLKFRLMVSLQIILVHFLPFLILIACAGIGTPNLLEFAFDFTKIFLAFSMSYLLSVQIYFLNIDSIKKIINYTLFFSILILSIELLIRVSTNQGSVLDIFLMNFYLLKVNSPFFQDTNATALYAMSFLCVAVYYNNEFLVQKSKLISFLTFLIFAFIVTTLSRAAIISSIALFIFTVFMQVSLSKKVIFMMFSLIICFWGFTLLLGVVSSDGSGVSKLLILENVIDKYDAMSTSDFLFGFGINQGNYIYSFHEGEYSHLLLTMLLGQVGIIGVFTYVMFFVFKICTSKFSVAYVFIPYFIVGLSYLHPFLESVFFASGFVFGLQRWKYMNKHHIQNGII